MRAARVISEGRDCGSHYWNVLNDAVALDLTIGQFAAPLSLEEISLVFPFELLRNENTLARWITLEARIIESEK